MCVQDHIYIHHLQEYFISKTKTNYKADIRNSKIIIAFDTNHHFKPRVKSTKTHAGEGGQLTVSDTRAIRQHEHVRAWDDHLYTYSSKRQLVWASRLEEYIHSLPQSVCTSVPIASLSSLFVVMQVNHHSATHQNDLAFVSRLV